MRHAHNTRFGQLIASGARDFFLAEEGGTSREISLSDDAFWQAMNLVKAGLDYEACEATEDETTTGNTVFGLLEGRIENNRQVSRLVNQMIDHGFNPLRATLDELLNLFKNSRRIEMLAEHLLLKEAQGVGLRDAQGGNLYHWMAVYDLWGLEILVQPLIRGNPSPEQQAWINQVNDNGDTPLHVLWGEAAEKYTQEGRTGTAAVARAQRVNIWSAHTTKHLMCWGADVLATNQQGLTAWDLMSRRDLAWVGSEEEAPVLRETLSIIENKIMDRDTAQAKARGKSGLRL